MCLSPHHHGVPSQFYPPIGTEPQVLQFLLSLQVLCLLVGQLDDEFVNTLEPSEQVFFGFVEFLVRNPVRRRDECAQ